MEIRVSGAIVVKIRNGIIKTDEPVRYYLGEESLIVERIKKSDVMPFTISQDGKTITALPGKPMKNVSIDNGKYFCARNHGSVRIDATTTINGELVSDIIQKYQRMTVLNEELNPAHVHAVYAYDHAIIRIEDADFKLKAKFEAHESNIFLNNVKADQITARAFLSGNIIAKTTYAENCRALNYGTGRISGLHATKIFNASSFMHTGTITCTANTDATVCISTSPKSKNNVVITKINPKE